MRCCLRQVPSVSINAPGKSPFVSGLIELQKDSGPSESVLLKDFEGVVFDFFWKSTTPFLLKILAYNEGE